MQHCADSFAFIDGVTNDIMLRLALHLDGERVKCLQQIKASNEAKTAAERMMRLI